ncbi:hypothetical protein DFH09DRAFT_1282498 [Mycena vulgaris]|nr:hypothetical protein DFH09DRAFT_1282498 [Mycena vulgaris]
MDQHPSWISIPALKSFLEARAGDTIMIASPAVPARVKRESDASLVVDLTIKSEPVTASLPVRTRSQLEGGREVIELLSDSDNDEAPSPSTSAAGGITDQGNRVRHSYPELNSAQSDWTSESGQSSGFPNDSSNGDLSPESGCSDLDDLISDGLKKSKTIRLDPHVSSMVREVTAFSFTSDARTRVEQIEYLSELPTLWPVPRVRTAFVLDLSDPKFKIPDENGSLIPVDVLVSGQDNDSWKGSSAAADPTVDVRFAPGEEPIACRRKRQDCRGCHHCEALDKSLVDVTRYELDIATRDVVLEAQQETRRHAGVTAEQRATAFFDRVKSTACKAKQHIVKADPVGGKSRGHLYWIACDGWTPHFKESHRTHSIPDNVDEGLLIKLFDDKPLADDDSADTNECSRIVHPHTGGHPHIIKGKAVAQCPIVHRACKCKRTYYVPVDRTIRKLLIFHPNGLPHNHPIPPPLKPGYNARSKYSQCIQVRGLLGSTVAEVDNAPSTQFLLDAQRPGQYDAALNNKRLKRDMLGKEKKKNYPAGLGITGGAYELYRQDRKKPLEERYIHRFQEAPGGGLIIFTCFTALLSLLDDPGVKAFEDDTTFRRIEGDLNEWEVVIFYNALERAITLARSYIDRSDTKFFELLFDIFREIKIEATGKDIAFARFMPNGNLLVMNADIEAAQALGAARSFMKTNVPSFSGITTLDPQLFTTYFIKFCCSHAQRPLPEFRSLVSTEDYRRLKDFLHIDSVESLRAFADFIRGLCVKKIQEMNDWVIPCLVKSQSNIFPEHWDSTPATTNTGEAQHHWTNSHTGIKLTLVEGIERTFRPPQEPARESANLTERKAELQAKINDQAAELKASKAEYKLLTGTTSRSSGSSHKSVDTVVVSSDSCGRVKTAPLAKRVKDTAETSLVTPILPINEADTNVEAYGMPGTDAMLPVHGSSIDATIPELPVPSAMLPSYVNEFHEAPGSCFQSSSVADPPAGDFCDVQAMDWRDFSPSKDLPRLHLPPPSSPPAPSPANIAPVEDSVASTPPLIATKDIDLDFNEKNIIHSKRVRTVSSRAPALPPAKKLRSRYLSCYINVIEIGDNDMHELQDSNCKGCTQSRAREEGDGVVRSKCELPTVRGRHGRLGCNKVASLTAYCCHRKDRIWLPSKQFEVRDFLRARDEVALTPHPRKKNLLPHMENATIQITRGGNGANVAYIGHGSEEAAELRIVLVPNFVVCFSSQNVHINREECCICAIDETFFDIFGDLGGCKKRVDLVGAGREDGRDACELLGRIICKQPESGGV